MKKKKKKKKYSCATKKVLIRKWLWCQACFSRQIISTVPYDTIEC